MALLVQRELVFERLPGTDKVLIHNLVEGWPICIRIEHLFAAHECAERVLSDWESGDDHGGEVKISDRISFEWETGSPFVHIRRRGAKRETMLLSDFVGLASSANAALAKIRAHQAGQIVKLSERGPLFLVESHN